MALEPAGYADKLGNRYEGRWVVKQLFRLLDERIQTVTWEPTGEGVNGIDVTVETVDGILWAYQCKVRIASHERWTPADLKSRGILDAMRKHLDSGKDREFAVVSPIEGKLVEDICQSARNSKGNSEAFYAHQIQEVGEDRRRAFRQLCKYFDLDFQLDTDRKRAFDYLRRFHMIHWEDDVEARENLYDTSRVLVANDPELVIPALIEFAQNNLRKAMGVGDVYNYLISHQFQPRKLAHDCRVMSGIVQLQDQFKASIKPVLIAEKLIPRHETQEVLNALDDSGFVIIHGRAGCGKSGVLYELVTILEQRKQTYLPIRLDRRIPKDNERKFGQDLELPESPARCLEAATSIGPSILILDQLDAIRWTARHSLNALEVCRSLVDEIVTMRNLERPVAVVLACRSFDLEHDPEIKSWLSSPLMRFKRINITELNDEDVQRVCEEKYKSLGKQQRDLLKLPSHLAMWVKMTFSGEVPTFQTGPQLLRQFWNNRRCELEKTGISSTDIDAILNKLVGYMEEHACISAPFTIIEQQAGVFEIMQSSGLLTQTGSTVSFAHQSYLDYQISSRLLIEIHTGQGNICNWLGDKHVQSLFRREQLRQILILLQDENPQEFLVNVQEILESTHVRFHLKHLVLEILSQLDKPSTSLLVYLEGLLSRKQWYEHLIETVCVRHSPYILWLLHQGIIEQWLQSETQKQRNTALWLLRSVAEIIPDKVTEILKPYAERDEEWKRQVLASISWDEHADSDNMFELRLDLAKNGIYREWTDWRCLAKNRPDRAILLIEAVLSTWGVDDLQRNYHSNTHSRFERWTKEDYQSLLEAARACSNLTWTKLVPHIQRLSMTKEEDVDHESIWYEDRFDRSRGEMTTGILDMAIEAGKKLAQQSGISFFSKTKTLHDSSSGVIQFLLIQCYSAMPNQLADRMVEWLMSKPDKISIGPGIIETEWEPAVRIVKKYSPYCSDHIFQRLEHHLMDYHAPNEGEMARYYVSSWKQGYFVDFWGRPQYFLLPALDKKRRTTKVENLIKMLQRKYSQYSKERFLHGHFSKMGFVGSTLSHNRLSDISDRAWLEDIVGNPNIPDEDYKSRRWQEADDGGWRESSVRHFSRDLATIAKRFPSRFGNLALRFPENVNPSYVAAILEGLKQTKPSDGTDEDKANWTPASVKLTEDVINKFLNTHDRQVASEFCSLLNARSEEEWSDRILQRLIGYAKSHPDPENGKLVVDDAGGDFKASKASVHNLQTNALNVVRGQAALAIGALLWSHPDWLGLFEPAFDSLIVDKHPAVRIASVEACLPILNINRETAIQWFRQLCNDDPRVTACRAGVWFFNCGIQSHREVLEPLIISMVSSDCPEVAEEGAEEVAARWIINSFFEKELKDCLSGSVPQRKGVAKAGAHLIKKSEHTDKCFQLLINLMDDPDSSVQSEIGYAFRDKDIFSIPKSQEIISRYLHSKTYQHDPTPLFVAMEKTSGSLLPHSELIIGICKQFAGPLRDASRDMSSGIAGDIHMLLPLLLRLYEQAQEISDITIINSCLDAWDLLYESRVGFVQELTQSIEQ